MWALPAQVKEIQQEANAEPEKVQEKDAKQTAAADLSKRLKNLHTRNDASSLKEERRKRKMEQARLHQLEKNGTSAS